MPNFPPVPTVQAISVPLVMNTVLVLTSPPAPPAPETAERTPSATLRTAFGQLNP